MLGTMKIKREDCTHCGRPTPVRNNGELREHKAKPHHKRPCPGSGRRGAVKLPPPPAPRKKASKKKAGKKKAGSSRPIDLIDVVEQHMATWDDDDDGEQPAEPAEQLEEPPPVRDFAPLDAGGDYDGVLVKVGQRVELLDTWGKPEGRAGVVIEVGRPYARGSGCPVTISVDGSETPEQRNSAHTRVVAGGVQVKAMRERLGLSQRELAKLLQVSKRTVIRLDAGGEQSGPVALLLRALDCATASGRKHALVWRGRDLLHPRRWVKRDSLELWSALFGLAGEVAP
jgi:DNA-binding XRE family transcriptional regulator